MQNDKDNLSKVWTIISNAVPPVGFFLYFKHRGQFPNKAKSALTSALIGIPIALGMGYVMNTYVFK